MEFREMTNHQYQEWRLHGSGRNPFPAEVEFFRIRDGVNDPVFCIAILDLGNAVMVGSAYNQRSFRPDQLSEIMNQEAERLCQLAFQS